MGIGGVFKKGFGKLGKLRKVGSGAANKIKNKVNSEESIGGSQTPPPAWNAPSYSRIYSGGAAVSKKMIMYFLIIILLGGGGVALFLFTPVGLFMRAPAFQLQYSAGSFMNSFGVRSMINQLMNPFAVQPTQAQTEHTNPHTSFVEAIGESLTLKGDVIPNTVEVGNTPFNIYLTVNNEGTDSVNHLWVLLEPIAKDKYSRNYIGDAFNQLTASQIGLPQNNILVLASNSKSLCGIMKDDQICDKEEEMDNRFFWFEYNGSLMTGSSLEIPISDIYIPNSGGTPLPENGQKVAMPFLARVYTYYVSASRLPITFINQNFTTMLYRMGKFKYSEVPATAMAGTAMKINLDAGQQPISSQTKRLTILINYENVGHGKLFGSPIIFLIYPSKVFSQCSEEYFWCESLSDLRKNASKGEDVFCNSYNHTLLLSDFFYPYYSTPGGFARKEIDWLCGKGVTDDTAGSDMTVCTSMPALYGIKEFKTFACTVNVNVNMHGTNRQTYYVTAFSIYPYSYTIPLTVNVYSLSQGS